MKERETLIEGLELLGAQIDAQAVDKLLKFSQLLLEKNKVMNLTAITDPMDVVKRHFLDCAVLIKHMKPGERVLDVGTGAGFPGLPLAILCPQTEFVLLDALSKRISFLQEVIAALGLTNVTAVHARAEEYAAEHRERFDCAVSRAVANLSMLSELTLPLLKQGGCFFAMKAADCSEEVEAAQAASQILGGGPIALEIYEVPLGEISRALAVIQKLGETPAKYPRRFAKISASPLGGK